MKKTYFLLSFISGALYALAFPLFNGMTLWIAPLLVITSFFLFNLCLEKHLSLKFQLIIGLLYSLGFYSVGFYWIPHLLNEFGGLIFPFNVSLGLLFSLIIIPQVYLYIYIKRKYDQLYFLAFLYTLLEIYIPQEFPAHLGHSFLALSPISKLPMANIFGSGFYTFIVTSWGLYFLQVLIKKTKRIPYLAINILLTILGLISFQESSKITSSHHLKIRIVQPNIGNFIKIDSERGNSQSMKQVYERYIKLSTENLPPNTDLIIWPETAYPQLLSSTHLNLRGPEKFPETLKIIIEKTQSELFIGGYDFNFSARDNLDFEGQFNTAFHFSKSLILKNVYHKMHLIPFGEGLPFGPLNQPLSKIIPNIAFFAKGVKATDFSLPTGLHFTSAICYEILFPDLIRQTLNEVETEPDFLINLTNDSWYGNTAEPFQHLFLAKWRAKEFNLPIIRSTNTGISTVIMPDDTNQKQLGIGIENYQDYSLDIAKRQKTFFQEYGQWPLILLGILLTLIEFIVLKKNLLSINREDE